MGMFDDVLVEGPHANRVSRAVVRRVQLRCSFAAITRARRGELVEERLLWVELRATVRVIGDDEPVAIAHRELRVARRARTPRRRR
jgi:hypothetical protein